MTVIAHPIQEGGILSNSREPEPSEGRRLHKGSWCRRRCVRRPELHETVDQMENSTSNREKKNRWKKRLGVIDLARKSRYVMVGWEGYATAFLCKESEMRTGG